MIERSSLTDKLQDLAIPRELFGLGNKDKSIGKPLARNLLFYSKCWASPDTLRFCRQHSGIVLLLRKEQDPVLFCYTEKHYSLMFSTSG